MNDHMRSLPLATLCECGRPLGVHGAAPPHTIGDACAGFQRKSRRFPGHLPKEPSHD